MSRFLRWADTEHALGTRIVVTLLVGGGIFVILLPYLLVAVCPSVDRRFGLRLFKSGIATYIPGGILITVGLTIALWSVLVQLTRGRGTPLPVMPTRKLLRTGPFRYCRNPMVLGPILAYLGVSIAAATVAGIALVLCVAGLLLTYIKCVEERELAERFGEEYLSYKREVPFIIPRRPARHVD